MIFRLDSTNQGVSGGFIACYYLEHGVIHALVGAYMVESMFLLEQTRCNPLHHCRVITLSLNAASAEQESSLIWIACKKKFWLRLLKKMFDVCSSHELTGKQFNTGSLDHGVWDCVEPTHEQSLVHGLVTMRSNHLS